MEFAALMNRAKANTEKERAAALAKNAELEAQRRRDAELEVVRKRQDDERKRKEAEARAKRERENKLIEDKLALERERKRLEKAKLEDQQVTPVASTSTLPIPRAAAIRKKRKKDALFSDDEDSSSSRGVKRKSATPVKKKVVPISANMSAKERLRAQFDPADAVMLNVNKRDTRTIEEIEADLRKKKGEPVKQSVFVGRKRHKSASPPPPPPRKQPSPLPTKKKKTQASYSPEPRNRRQEIWEILNPGKKYRFQEYDSDSDDMEAGIDEIEREDREAERIAKREDKEELARLEARAKQKGKRLN